MFRTAFHLAANFTLCLALFIAFMFFGYGLGEFIEKVVLH